MSSLMERIRSGGITVEVVDGNPLDGEVSFLVTAKLQKLTATERSEMINSVREAVESFAPYAGVSVTFDGSSRIVKVVRAALVKGAKAVAGVFKRRKPKRKAKPSAEVTP